MVRGTGPCKNCTERKDYIEKGISCHSVCEKYKKFDEENKLIRKKRTDDAIFRRIHKESYTKPPMNNPRKNHRKKV